MNLYFILCTGNVSGECRNVTLYGPAKCPVYLKLPYIGPTAELYRKKITDTVTKCYFAVKPRIIFSSKPILRSSTKDFLPTHSRSNLIYMFKCCCDSTYVGRTSQRLENRILQHVPKSTQKILGKSPSPPTSISTQSAIAEHLLKNQNCGRNFSTAMFTIVDRGRSPFHLQILEALHISTKRPELCRQKKFVYTTVLFKHLCPDRLA